MLELILEVVGELFLQVAVELLADCGIHVFKRKPLRNPVAAAVGYLLFGAVAGGLSLLVFEDSFITHPALRVANLVLAPVLAGYAMALIGKARNKRGKEPLRLERFAYGFLFAFGISLVRFLWA